MVAWLYGVGRNAILPVTTPGEWCGFGQSQLFRVDSNGKG